MTTNYSGATWWFVTRPMTAQSGLENICFAASLGGLQSQMLGGIDLAEIIGMFKDERSARGLALRVLAGMPIVEALREEVAS